MKQFVFALALGLLVNLPLQAASNYVIRIDGMTCKFCAHNVKKQLKKLEGVEQVEVDQDKGTATLVIKDGASLTDATLQKAIADAGYNYRGMLSKSEQDQ